MLELNSLGIPEAKIKQLNNKGITSVGDLLNFYPRTYKDISIRDYTTVEEGDFFATVVKVCDIYDNKKNITMKCLDWNNRSFTITWFNKRYLLKSTLVNRDYFIAGQLSFFRGNPNMVNPQMFSLYTGNEPCLLPVYSEIKGMALEYLQSIIKRSLLCVEDDYLEPELIERFKLPNRKDALELVHNPTQMKEVAIALRRLRFDDLFSFQFKMKRMRESKRSKTSILPTDSSVVNDFIKNLPFELTRGEGQFDAIKEMYQKLKNKELINALVQGDVSCGKTMVAMIMLLFFATNGYQGVLMAPTQVLAEQHYLEMKKAFEPYGVNVGYLSGSMKVKEKRPVIAGVKDGSIQILVGTHSVIGKDVEFKNLGLAVTDEEHKFGVLQRESLTQKSGEEIHSIIMSATPIPRSIAMSLYGNALDIITIKAMPNGRLPVKTKVAYKLDFVYEHMLREINHGRQCYVVCPLIESSEKMENVVSIEDAYRELTSYFSDKGIKIGVITGKMDKKEIDEIIHNFKEKQYDILLSTTIIEVGVNVPNATVILIRNAERFGLAQLHQLRGRVGRSSMQSFCYLESKAQIERLSVMEETNNGFEIAMADFKSRGAGELLGTEQSGESNCICLMIEHPKMNQVILDELDRIFADEGRLNYYNERLLGIKTLKCS